MFNNLDNILVKLTKRIMLLKPSFPEKDRYSLQEIFNQREFTEGSIEDKREIMLRSSQHRYDYENEIPFLEKYFGFVNRGEYEGKSVLDLGCFNGGRLVAWKEKYNFGYAEGIDINPVYEEAGKQFANIRNQKVTFKTGYGEELPYESNSFDIIISTDVFEHVKNVEKVMDECYRILKPGGKLLTTFPQYYQPLESHLGRVTKVPALHWFFNGKILAKAAYEIGLEREPESYWYRHKNPTLQDWEKMYSLNGITVSKFRIIVKKNDWEILYWSKKPILTDGRRAKRIYFRLLSLLFMIPAKLPIIEEIFLGRICCVLEKKSY
jgi:ubiquinone/menaquinone biosynthesis C-methylase UbiE